MAVKDWKKMKILVRISLEQIISLKAMLMFAKRFARQEDKKIVDEIMGEIGKKLRVIGVDPETVERLIKF